jgi:carbon starvation protein CstA
MISLSVSIVLLLVGYFLYSRIIEKVFGADPARKTPAYEKNDGVDFVPMPQWKVALTQFFNIAGLGAVFGAVMGALFGPAAFIWIVVGCVFAGGVHDYFSGMISLRHGGISFSEIVGEYMGNGCMQVVRVTTILALVLTGMVFVLSPAEVLSTLSDSTWLEHIGFDRESGGSRPVFFFWVCLIFAYYVFAVICPIDQITRRFYPVFGGMIILTVCIFCFCLYYYLPDVPEITQALQDHHPAGYPVFPMLFVTLTCGAISGFHATQSPIMARCLVNEKMGRSVFYGAMIAEGIIALIMAAIASHVFHSPGRNFVLSEGNPATAVLQYATSHWMGPFLGTFAMIGVALFAVTSGDTAFRAARLMLADILHLEQHSLRNRLFLSIPLFVAGFLLIFVNFDMAWRHFSFFNQSQGTICLWMLTIYLARKRKNYWIGLVPSSFMTMVIAAYLFVAPELLELPTWLSNLFGCVIMSMCVLLFFIWKAGVDIENSRNDISRIINGPDNFNRVKEDEQTVQR